MQQNNRQAFPLRKWQSRKRKSTDPHFSGRGSLKPSIARYIADCYRSDESPELFLTAWVDAANGTVMFGLAVPYEYIPQEHIPTLDDFFE